MGVSFSAQAQCDMSKTEDKKSLSYLGRKKNNQTSRNKRTQRLLNVAIIVI